MSRSFNSDKPSDVTEEIPPQPVPPTDEELIAQGIPIQRKARGNKNSPIVSVTWEVYSAMWNDYKAGLRMMSRLAEKYKLTEKTVSRIVLRGYPRRGWGSFVDRLKNETFEQEMLEAKAVAALAAERRLEAAKAETDTLKVAQGIRYVGAKALVALHKAIDASTTNRLRREKKPDGTYVTVELPPTTLDVLRTLHELVRCVKVTQEIESIYFGGQEEKAAYIKTMVSATTRKVTAVSQEQIDYIIAHEGKLPDGITTDDLLGITVTSGSDMN